MSPPSFTHQWNAAWGRYTASVDNTILYAFTWAGAPYLAATMKTSQDAAIAQIAAGTIFNRVKGTIAATTCFNQLFGSCRSASFITNDNPNPFYDTPDATISQNLPAFADAWLEALNNIGGAGPAGRDIGGRPPFGAFWMTITNHSSQTFNLANSGNPPIDDPSVTIINTPSQTLDTDVWSTTLAWTAPDPVESGKYSANLQWNNAAGDFFFATDVLVYAGETPYWQYLFSGMEEYTTEQGGINTVVNYPIPASVPLAISAIVAPVGDAIQLYIDIEDKAVSDQLKSKL